MAKTQTRQTSGLGNASPKRRNARIQHIDEKTWASQRKAFFIRNVKKAAAAKAYRLLHDVALWEIAVYYNRSVGCAANWESGKYAWQGGSLEVDEYMQVVRRIANR